MGLDQIGITLSGVMAVWLTQDARATWRRWACIFGMLAQPFWFYAAWKAEQWGIFAMCMLYSSAWARGVWTHWFSPSPKAREQRRNVVAKAIAGPGKRSHSRSVFTLFAPQQIAHVSGDVPAGDKTTTLSSYRCIAQERCCAAR